MNEQTIHRIAMNLLLETQESKEGLLWTTDWSTETDSLNEEGQRMLTELSKLSKIHLKKTL